MRMLLAIVASLALSTAAEAQEAPVRACSAQIAPGGELAPWAAPRPLSAAGDVNRLPRLAPGQAVDVRLLPTPQVRYALRPDKLGDAASYGGLIGLEVREGATYRIALGSGAWIDLVRDGKAIASTSHGHGPDCTGVHKIVDFPLTPGRYTLQLSAGKEAQTRMLIARLP